MTDPTAEAQALLAETSTEGLLRAAYAFTHRIHESDDVQHTLDLQAQRYLITAEVLRRTADYDALNA